MAARSFHDPKVAAHGRVILWATFLPAADGAPTGLVGKGFASVVRTSEGVFTLTLQDKYMALEAHSVTLMLAAASEVVPELDSETVATTKTVVVRTVDKATGLVADIAADADNRVSVVLFLRNTSVD